MVMSTHGLPVTSRTLPLKEPSNCAAARGATVPSSATAIDTANSQDFFPCERGTVTRRGDREALNADSFMLESPFVAGRLLLEVPRAACALLSLIQAVSQEHRRLVACYHPSVRYRVCSPGFGKRLQPQQATVANAARHILALVARPGQ